jgi:transposase-like protein
MFNPPHCPYRHCAHHLTPADERWFVRFGHYKPLCRAHPVPRFRCLGCLRYFSRQTFRLDYRDHRPDLNPKLFELLASGVGLRQSSRVLGLSRRCLELKHRKIGRHLRRLNLNLQGPLPLGSVLQLDEIETYEGLRTLRPLTVPVLIEKHSRFIIWAESAPIPARHRKTRHGRTRSDELRRKGRRPDGSRRACRRTLGRASALACDLRTIGIETDEKRSYPSLIRAAFGGKHGIAHSTTKSTRRRDVSNPLFAINQTEAMARDLMGRLRRQSWLVSKKRRYLDMALALFIAWRNLVRRRFNHDEESPAQILEFAPRRMTEEELCSWRQDWGRRSIHPLAWNAESIEHCVQRRLRTAS